MKRFLLILAATSICGVSVAASKSTPDFKDLTSDQFTPAGWVEEFLNRQVTGLTGHPEQSGFPYDRNGWIDGLPYTEREIPGGKSWFPYEQMAYYLDGALRCGYMVNNADLKSRARENINYVMESADENGQFHIYDIEDDWWPLVVMIRLMVEEYEVTKDPAILNALVRHYKATYADGKGQNFVFTGFSSRSLLHVEHLCSLYGYTGDKWFIDMAETLYRVFEGDDKKLNPTTAEGMNADKSPSGHAVTYHEFLKLPITLYYYTGKEYYKTAFERAFQMLEEQHELADGLSSGVEFLSGKSSNMSHELCNTIDFNWTAGWALLATGEAKYADKIERCIYNSGFAGITPDFKAHQYYTSPNLAVSSNMSSEYNDNTNWGFHGKKRLCYRPGHDTECCSGNVHRMLPTFINRSTMVSGDDVSINLYIPGSTQLKINGSYMKFTQQTNYPFEFSSKITINDAARSKVDLALRIPGWATSYRIMLNGKLYSSAKCEDATYKIISRKFLDGDVVEISFETEPCFKPTAEGVAVNYGPLVYSYPIEYVTKLIVDDGAGKCSEDFPAYEFYPRDPLGWAYALNVDGGIEVESGSCDGGCCGGYPWEIGGSPVKLKVKAKAVKNWRLREWIYITEYPEKVECEGDEVTLTLEPIGSTILRITDFPTIKEQ